MSDMPTPDPGAQWRDVPIDWEALEDAFENNAPEVHSYLHVPTGDVLRIVDGVADPQMHARIAGDQNYLRIEPVSSREQYRWMERFIPMVEEGELQTRLTRAIDGKGAFRRFKDVLMSFGPDRERWFAFRSERLRIFMEAWLNAHALNPVKRPVWVPEMAEEVPSQPKRDRRARTTDALRRQLRDLSEALGTRDLEHLTAFGEFLRARRATRPSSPAGPLESSPGDVEASSDAGVSDAEVSDAGVSNAGDSDSDRSRTDRVSGAARPSTKKAKADDEPSSAKVPSKKRAAESA